MWLKDNSKKESGVPAEIVRIGEKGAGAGVEGKSKEESRRQNKKIQLSVSLVDGKSVEAPLMI